MMDLPRFTALCEAYGGDPARWPEGERAAALAMTAADPAAAQALADARALDETLEASRPVPPSAVLRDRILASAPKPRPASGLRFGWGLRAGLGAGLAAAGIAGVLVGSALTAPADEAASAAAVAALDSSPEATAFGPADVQEG